MPDAPIPYLDCNATTPVCAPARDAVIAAMEACGNASSAHKPGREASGHVEASRAAVASLLGGVDPSSVIFTSGATEANNIATFGVVAAARRDGRKKPHVVTSLIEHSSVLAPLRKLARDGAIELHEVAVDASGVVKVADVAAAICPETVLVSVQGANNEIGTLQPIVAIGALCRARRVLFHADLCQSYGKVMFDPDAFDLASMSAHKVYGPTGVGALYGRPEVLAWLEPQTLGGGQENTRRAGTLNTHGIAGFGAACRWMADNWPGEAIRLRSLRDQLLAELRAALPDLRVNGAIEAPCWVAGYGTPLRLPHNLNVTLPGVDGQAFHAAVREKVALSAGSACKALGGTGSHVLAAIGALNDGSANVRIGLGSCVSDEDIGVAVRAIIEAAQSAKRIE